MLIFLVSFHQMLSGILRKVLQLLQLSWINKLSLPSYKSGTAGAWAVYEIVCIAVASEASLSLGTATGLLWFSPSSGTSCSYLDICRIILRDKAVVCSFSYVSNCPVINLMQLCCCFCTGRAFAGRDKKFKWGSTTQRYGKQQLGKITYIVNLSTKKG